MADQKPYALISVTNKTDIEDFGRRIVNLGMNIVSTGGTAKVLRSAGVPLQTVAELRFEIFEKKMQKHCWSVVDYCEPEKDKPVDLREFFEALFPSEILDHRVATLHGEIQGGILATKNMMDELVSHGYPPIKLTCIDFYQFEAAAKNSDLSFAEVMDKIDIGGPNALRGAGKNLGIPIYDFVDRERILRMLETTGDVDEVTRIELAENAFRKVGNYNIATAHYLDGELLKRGDHSIQQA